MNARLAASVLLVLRPLAVGAAGQEAGILNCANGYDTLNGM